MGAKRSKVMRQTAAIATIAAANDYWRE